MRTVEMNFDPGLQQIIIVRALRKLRYQLIRVLGNN
jgi:hypothetical protein